MKNHRYDRSQRLIVWVSYILQILLFPALLGVLINVVKIRQYARLATAELRTRPEVIALLISHHRWLMRTFVIFSFLMAMAIGTLYYGFGYLLGIGALGWWLYRVLRGMIVYAEGKPMPV